MPPPDTTPGVHVVTLAGALAGNAPALRTMLVDALGRKGPRLVLDMSAVTSCDEPVVRVVEEAAARAWRRGGWCRIAAPSAAVRESFERVHGPGGPGRYELVEETAGSPRRRRARPSGQQ